MQGDNLTYLDLKKFQAYMKWVWLALRSNIIRFSYELSPSTYGLSEYSDSISLGLTTYWAQVHIGLIRCQT